MQHNLPLSRRDLLAAALAAGAGAALAPETGAAVAATDRAKDVLTPPKPSDVKLEGYVGRKMELCLKNRVTAQDIGKLVRPFQTQTEVGDGDWRCEYWGKWYTSAVEACAWQPTAEDRAVVDRAVRALLATQGPDGYIGTRKKPDRLLGWDVWGRKYVLLGLLAYYDLTGDKGVLAAAERHEDSLMAEVGPGKANLAETGYAGWKGLPPSSVLEPTVLLYRRTGDPKYLAFARYIVGQWAVPNKLAPAGLQLIHKALGGTPVAKMVAPKAYEMTSCYEGVCELYRATGDPKYLEACRKIAESIIQSELFVVGSGSSREVWFDGRFKQTLPNPDPMETCVTATWMKYCYQLLRLTGESRYADEMERSLYNALLGALKPDGSWWCYYTPMMGMKRPSHIQHADVGLSCCVTNGPRALMLTPDWAVMQHAEGPVVNLYGPGSATVRLPSGRAARITQRTTYPVGDRVELTIHSARPETFTLRLRIPAWSERTALTLNGKPAGVPLTPGSYAVVKRRWRDGDRVTLTLDLRGRVVDDPGKTGSVAIVRGPIVLAADRRLQPEGPTRAARFKRDAAGRIALTTAAREDHADVWMAFRAPCVADNGSDAGSLTLCDYASAGNTWNRASEFRVWFPQPLRVLDFGVVNLDGARWIWHAADGGNPASAAPAGTRLFRRAFDLPAGLTFTAARLGVGADDTFTAWVNGHEVGRGDDWRHVQSFDIARLLRPGRNVIAVAVRNTTPSPAGLIARLEVVPAEGQPLVLLTDADWRSAERAPDGWQQPDFGDTADAAWQPARIVGPYGIEPWGDIG